MPKSCNTLQIPYRDFLSPTGHSFDLPAVTSGNRASRYREPCVHVLVQFKTPNPDGQRSTFHACRGFPYRDIATRDVNNLISNPEYRGADSPIQRHLYSTSSRGPTLPRHLGISRIANPRCKFSLLSKTPNAEPRFSDSSGSCATCPCSDRRLPLIREIATRDFNES
jgi:hypothetical protein